MRGLSAKTVAAVEFLARSDRRVAAVPEQFDADPWLFNMPAGTTDLQTGVMREHRPLDYITKLAAASPDKGCPIPMFLRFLSTIFARDADLIKYIQKVFGYCLTGDIREHAMFFGYGTGANGKGVLLSTVAGILDDYCKTAHSDTFTITNSNQHPTDVAGLMGARLVICPEVEQGRRWAESKIKALTGGDRIRARFMRQDFFEFTPQFKLFITGNHKPGLRNVDEAMRRRFHLIPFTVTVPPEDRDPLLAVKLKAEWPGILQWMIEGCLLWQAEGLARPAAVERATGAYLQAENTVLTWVDERCQRGPQLETLAAHLYASWKTWAEDTGEFVGTAKALYSKLDDTFEKRHSKKGTMFRGLGLADTAR